jgi:hypothetical protein
MKRHIWAMATDLTGTVRTWRKCRASAGQRWLQAEPVSQVPDLVGDGRLAGLAHVGGLDGALGTAGVGDAQGAQAALVADTARFAGRDYRGGPENAAALAPARLQARIARID